MPASKDSNRCFKVYYTPIEAAIRWSGLIRYERRILAELQPRTGSTAVDYQRWPAVRFNLERIRDGILNRELHCSINGIASPQVLDVDDPRLTLRHIDLKSWMVRYYPDERPAFLFSKLERQAHPLITVDAVNALLVERDALKSLLEASHRKVHRDQRKRAVAAAPDESAGPRNETTYLHIVGGLLTLLLGRSPAGKPYSSFTTQDAIIDAMMAHYGGRLGITERTLQAKFAEAKRRLSAG